MRDLPPYARLLQLRIDRQSDGGPLVLMPFHDDVVGRPGYLHGGAIAGLLEFAAFTTLIHELGDDSVRMKPVTVTVDYMLRCNRAAIPVGAPLKFSGKDDEPA